MVYSDLNLVWSIITMVVVLGVVVATWPGSRPSVAAAASPETRSGEPSGALIAPAAVVSASQGRSTKTIQRIAAAPIPIAVAALRGRTPVAVRV